MATYLNDHLAGSIAALGMVGRIHRVHAGTPLGDVIREFEVTLSEEQAVVRSLIERVGGNPSAIRRAVAWIGGQVSRLKVGPGETDESGLELFEALELLSVGFCGRRLLWRTLAHVGRASDADLSAHYDRLATRAEAQLVTLEVHRLEASVAALTTPATDAPLLRSEIGAPSQP
jgi:hypothetical protein